ncbi:type A2 lantipeptide [Anabaena subtropica]|uniref:Type A2 lantipeptide n=1 Tax=Anabaena subtropica FACHB-260 TaxID=2692884 RepID=A0ABR8CIF1_9NOST|nr:type A2 lantipeptide [Anabaena subtropica]MBD2342608.1 type A2 lantipeptide [Anabaena subtropica FACHB-260]
MSNENLEQDNNEKIQINENGELVIKDPQLADALQELSPEELEAIAGGNANYVACGANYQCGKTSASFDQIAE